MTEPPVHSQQRWSTAFALAWCFGWLGAHRFYLGWAPSGLGQLLLFAATFSLFTKTPNVWPNQSRGVGCTTLMLILFAWVILDLLMLWRGGLNSRSRVPLAPTPSEKKRAFHGGLLGGLFGLFLLIGSMLLVRTQSESLGFWSPPISVVGIHLDRWIHTAEWASQWNSLHLLMLFATGSWVGFSTTMGAAQVDTQKHHHIDGEVVKPLIPMGLLMLPTSFAIFASIYVWYVLAFGANTPVHQGDLFVSLYRSTHQQMIPVMGFCWSAILVFLLVLGLLVRWVLAETKKLKIALLSLGGVCVFWFIGWELFGKHSDKMWAAQSAPYFGEVFYTNNYLFQWGPAAWCLCCLLALSLQPYDSSDASPEPSANEYSTQRRGILITLSLFMVLAVLSLSPWLHDLRLLRDKILIQTSFDFSCTRPLYFFRSKTTHLAQNNQALLSVWKYSAFHVCCLAPVALVVYWKNRKAAWSTWQQRPLLWQVPLASLGFILLSLVGFYAGQKQRTDQELGRHHHQTTQMIDASLRPTSALHQMLREVGEQKASSHLDRTLRHVHRLITSEAHLFNAMFVFPKKINLFGRSLIRTSRPIPIQRAKRLLSLWQGYIRKRKKIAKYNRAIKVEAQSAYVMNTAMKQVAQILSLPHMAGAPRLVLGIPQLRLYPLGGKEKWWVTDWKKLSVSLVSYGSIWNKREYQSIFGNTKPPQSKLLGAAHRVRVSFDPKTGVSQLHHKEATHSFSLASPVGPLKTFLRQESKRKASRSRWVLICSKNLPYSHFVLLALIIRQLQKKQSRQHPIGLALAP